MIIIAHSQKITKTSYKPSYLGCKNRFLSNSVQKFRMKKIKIELGKRNYRRKQWLNPQGFGLEAAILTHARASQSVDDTSVFWETIFFTYHGYVKHEIQLLEAPSLGVSGPITLFGCRHLLLVCNGIHPWTGCELVRVLMKVSSGTLMLICATKVQY